MGIDLLPFSQEIVQLGLAADAAQGGLGELRGSKEIVLDLDRRSVGIDHAKIEHSVHLDRHVVAGNHVLRRDVHGDCAQVYPDHALHHWNHVNETWPAVGHQPSETKNDGPFILR